MWSCHWVQAVQGAVRAVARIYGCSYPEAAPNVAFAIVEADTAAVIGRICHFLGNVVPGERLVDAVSHRNQQRATSTRSNAPRLLGQVPVFQMVAGRMKAPQALERNVNPVEPLLLRVPEGRLTQRAWRIDHALPWGGGRAG